MTSLPQPNLILFLCGKRKSGKDFVFGKLVDEFIKPRSDRFVFRRIVLSSQLKKIYALEHNLDYERLLDSSDYKEAYRLDMIRWSDSIREEDPGFFCRKAIEAMEQTPPTDGKPIIWVVTDARRKTDLAYFEEETSDERRTLVAIRVVADENVRAHRGWQFTHGVDDSVSECDLDDIDIDFVVSNNNDAELQGGLARVYNYLESFVAQFSLE